MNLKIKALIQILIAGLFGAGLMIGFKILSPDYGEQIFWILWFTMFMYFAYTLKVATMELQEFIKSLDK
jgi:hypothetical protein